MEAGTIGKGLPLETIKISLSGQISNIYDVYYRVHGWMSWAKNGESAGTSGQGLAIEAYQVLLIKKGMMLQVIQNTIIEKQNGLLMNMVINICMIFLETK